ncbi:rod shape-determining protein MreD [Clostridium formicaceticum]|uniref:Rod shape-determining protein MreD n=1 Tax=Clostridium formicaceticum TaxID=1497 RepID=A0AAC9WG12_9CLOT|nr:rod shape-determining protein MreD [Clostridium formicaceticum]AOY76852.1 rod shape-determining protein MreD [Clostridium formicaceticum]ARE87331.1 rod shape-determining protein MreD [Clostridium formicaceticum]
MKTLLICFIIIINIILQPVLHYIGIYNVMPNTSLILVVCFAINSKKNHGALLGCIIGILQDIIFGKIIGINALIYMVIGYIINAINRNIFKENLAIPFIFTSLATVLYYCIGLFFVYFLGYNLQFLSIFRNMLVVEVLYNSIFSLLVYIYVSKIFKTKRSRY